MANQKQMNAKVENASIQQKADYDREDEPES